MLLVAVGRFEGRGRARQTPRGGLHHSLGRSGPLLFTVEGPRIVEASETKPAGVWLLTTVGVVLPGVVDMHNHPDCDVFAA